MSYCCFENGCELEVQYLCLCLSSKTYSCELHLDSHLKLPNRTHDLKNIFLRQTETSNDCTLGYFAREESKGEKLNKMMVSCPFKENLINSEKNPWNVLKNIVSDFEEVNGSSENISQHYNQTQLANQYISQPIHVTESDFSTIYGRWAELRSRRCDILNSAKNDPKIEQSFREASLLYQNQGYASNPLLNQAYQEYSNSYHQFTSLYLIGKIDQKINLLIYDTESEREKIKLIKFFSPKVEKERNFFQYKRKHRPWLEKPTCITQLPNGEHFCIYKEYSPSFKVLIIDRNGEFKELPSKSSCRISSAIYFNRNVYCFGKRNDIYTISRRFNLDLNQWFKLTPMPLKGCICNSTLFKGNILISQFLYKRLTLYTIEIDSFSIIPYEFSNNWWKILMSTNERLYLIDCGNKYIYESEDQFIWQIITESNIRYDYCQVYCSYNKGGIYISTIDCDNIREYYRFDLNQKTLIQIGFYLNDVTLRSLDEKLEAVECFNQTFKLDSDQATAYNKKRISLYDLGIMLERLRCYIYLEPVSYIYYRKNGYTCYEAMRLSEEEFAPYQNILSFYYNNIGNSLSDLGIKLRAIERCKKEVERYPSHADVHIDKGIALHDLNKDIEAIKSYDYAIKLDPKLSSAYFNKGIALLSLDKQGEALECYNKAIAIDERISFYFCYRAYLFIDLGREIEAMQDYQRAYNLELSWSNLKYFFSFKKENYISKREDQSDRKLLQKLCKLEKIAIEFKKAQPKFKDFILKIPEKIKKLKKKINN